MVCRFLDDVLNVNCNFFEIAPNIYPPKLKVTREKINPVSNTLPFHDLSLRLKNGKISYSTYDKRRQYQFDINRLPNADSNIHPKTVIGTVVSQVIGIYRTNLHFEDFIKKMQQLGVSFQHHLIPRSHYTKALNKFLARHYAKSKFNIPKKVARKALMGAY